MRHLFLKDVLGYASEVCPQGTHVGPLIFDINDPCQAVSAFLCPINRMTQAGLVHGEEEGGGKKGRQCGPPPGRLALRANHRRASRASLRQSHMTGAISSSAPSCTAPPSSYVPKHPRTTGGANLKPINPSLPKVGSATPSGLGTVPETAISEAQKVNWKRE